jgi:hypothetical protein
MGDESSAPSCCTSPDLQGYTTAGKEVVAGESGSNSSGSSNQTVRDFSPPQLRPRAKTVPRYIWKRPPGYVKPRSDLQLPPRDSRGRFQSRQRLRGVVIGESDDSQVGSGADLLEASASPSWDGFGFSDEHLDGTAAAGDWSTVAQFEASLVQPEAPVLEVEDILSVVPDGRESAETTMNQDDAADPPPADAGAAVAARSDAIEQRQDEAEEILVYLETAILPIVESVTTARMADEFAQRVDETIIRLGKCHGFLWRRDRANHTAELGPRIEEALAQLRDVLMRLTQLRAAETEEESEPEQERPPDPPPAGPRPPDPVFVESTRAAMVTATAKLCALCVEAKAFTESKRPTEDTDIYRLTEEFKLLSTQIDGACAKATAMAARAISCKLYAEEAALTTLITDTEGGKVAAQKVLMGWRTEAGVFAEKIGCGNRAAVKAPTFTGKPKYLSIYEFIKDWSAFKADSNCTVNEALKELKAAVREADKEVTNAMDTEEAILEHLIERFGNPIEMIRCREAEFTSWKPSKGTFEQRRDWFAHAHTRLQNIIELCTEHEVLDHLYNSQLNRLFQQKLDEDSIDILMEIFRKAMGKLKSLPKAKLYPCLLELCDEQIAKLSTRVTMLANPDTA